MLAHVRYRASDPHEKWCVIGKALDDNGKTFRLCLILLITALPTVIVTLATIVMTLKYG
jgi:hypothetical protein